MLAAKNSRKRIEARSPAAATSVGRLDKELIGTSWFIQVPLPRHCALPTDSRRRIATPRSRRSRGCYAVGSPARYDHAQCVRLDPWPRVLIEPPDKIEEVPAQLLLATLGSIRAFAARKA